MPEMYVKYIGYKPYAYMYGGEDAATALYYGDGYKTPEEAVEAWEFQSTHPVRGATAKENKYHV